MLTPSKLASAETRRAFSAPVSSLSFKALSMGHLPRAQGVIGLDQIGESMTLAVDFLIVLVTFTGQDNHVIRRSVGDQLGNRLATACDEGDFIHSGKTGADVVEDHCRVFSARVVIGHQHAVSQT